MINKKKEGGFGPVHDEKEILFLKDKFAIMLAAKDNEIVALKAKNGNDQG